MLSRALVEGTLPGTDCWQVPARRLLAVLISQQLLTSFFETDVDANRELPLTQPPSAHSSIASGSCPGTPEMRRRQEEAMRRLASQVWQHLGWLQALGTSLLSWDLWEALLSCTALAAGKSAHSMAYWGSREEELLEGVLLPSRKFLL